MPNEARPNPAMPHQVMQNTAMSILQIYVDTSGTTDINQF